VPIPLEDNDTCPECGGYGELMSDNVLRCEDCGLYFEPEDMDEPQRDKSARARTKLRNEDE